MTIESDIIFDYDTEASGPFTVGENLTFSGGAVGELIILIDNGTDGTMYVSIISGSTPANDETITGGTSSATAAVNGTPDQSLFPLKIREDISVAANGDIRWDSGAPALGTTHSCKYDTEASGPFTVNEILTFSGGATAELIELDDNGTDGELFFRLIGTTIPLDNETITGGTSSATAAVDGIVHNRSYTPLYLHRNLGDLSDNPSTADDDIYDKTYPRSSSRSTDEDITLLGDYNIDAALSYHMYGGSITQGDGDVIYSGYDLDIVATSSSIPVIIQNNALLSATTTAYWGNYYNGAENIGRIRIMVLTRTGGADIDGKRVTARLLEYGHQYYTDKTILGTGLVSRTLVSAESGDLNNTTAAATIATYTDITFTEGYTTEDLGNGNGAQPYYLLGDIGTRTKALSYERAKWLQRRGTSETIHGLNYQLFVGCTHNFAYDNEASGPFTEGETVSWGTGSTSGTGLLLGLDDDGATGNLYIQLLTGVAPTDGTEITGGTSSATCDVNGSVSTRTINNQFIGLFTGSDFICNFGIVFDADDVGAGDQFTDLTGTSQSPPNNQSGVVTGLVSGDSVTASPWDGSSYDASGDPEPDFDQLTANGVQSAGAGTVTVNETIPTDMPSSGSFRAYNGTSRDLVPYSSYSGSTFTLTGTLPNEIASGAGIMVQGIDTVTSSTQESFTAVFSSPRQYVIKVTRGDAAPIVPYIATTSFTSTGFSIPASRVSDL